MNIIQKASRYTYEIFNDAVTNSDFIVRWMVWWLMNNELEGMWKEAAVAWYDVSQHLPEGSDKSIVRLFGAYAEIRTENMSNTIQKVLLLELPCLVWVYTVYWKQLQEVGSYVLPRTSYFKWYPHE
jgi:hypothetical protein